MRTYGNKGSFLHGHYRVALDELSYKFGKGEHNDPFRVAGYVHLYCLERFLDLPAICKLPHVKVEADGRQIGKEPNGNFAPALGGNEYRIALNFVEAARVGRVQAQAEWASYPEHVESRNQDGSKQVEPKAHKHTLNHALQTCKNQGRGGRVMSRLKPSNVAVHHGDLEIYCLGRKNMLSNERVKEIMDDLEDSVKAPKGKKRFAPVDTETSASATKKVNY
jgi:hypothetical protein